MDSKSTLLARLKTWWDTTPKDEETVKMLINYAGVIIDGYLYNIVYDRDATSLVAQKDTYSIIIFSVHSLDNKQQLIAFLLKELNNLNGGKKRKTRRNNRNTRRTLIRRKMTGGNPPKKPASSASPAGLNRIIRYHVYSSDRKEFIITYYGPVNTAQNPHGIGRLYVGPTLHQTEAFKGNFDNGVVNDTNGKTTRSGVTLFDWGYIDASIKNGNIINHGNNEDLIEFKNKNIILDFTNTTKEWNYEY